MDQARQVLQGVGMLQDPQLQGGLQDYQSYGGTSRAQDAIGRLILMSLIGKGPSLDIGSLLRAGGQGSAAPVASPSPQVPGNQGLGQGLGGRRSQDVQAILGGDPYQK